MVGVLAVWFDGAKAGWDLRTRKGCVIDEPKVSD